MTRVWFLLNNRTELFKCETCGKILKTQFVDFDTGKHTRFCNAHCECINDNVKKTLNITNLKKYGCEWTFLSDNNKNKSKLTMLKKYGVEYAQLNRSIKTKSYNTMIKRYGVKNALELPEFNSLQILSRRITEYKKFLADKFVLPLFSIDEYLKFGNDHMYNWKCLKCQSIIYSAKNSSWLKLGCNKSPVRCEHCYPYMACTSREEIDVVNFLKTITNLSILNKQKENWLIIKPLELDIYIPKKQIAIEFDGLYWHSDDSGKNLSYHLNKTELCEQKGILLIHIFENEWRMKKAIVKDRLKNLLGVYDKTIFARKCQVKEVDSKTAFNFQESNHLQGAVNSKINLGLYLNDELVSLMTFSKPRFDRKHEWELVRFCNKLGYHVPGGASKLLKHFERTYQPKNLVSYADRRWSLGKLYYALGFKLDHISKPNYWYWKSAMLLESRISYQKHKLKSVLLKYNENLTEVENMTLNGYKRIFDCGNLIFIKQY